MPEFTTRPATPTDVESIRPILEHWVVDSETGQLIDGEVEDILRSIESPGDNREFLVAEADGSVVGVMGMSDPSPEMSEYTQTEHPVEVINAYVDPESRGQGVGELLLRALVSQASEHGATEIVVNSGPRYKDSGWKFWTKHFDDPTHVRKDHYGPGADAPVWREEIK